VFLFLLESGLKLALRFFFWCSVEYLSSVGSKPDVNKTTCQTNIPVEYTLHQKKGIRGGVYVKEKKHSLTGMHSAAVGEWRRWLVQVTQEEVTKTAEMLRKKVKEKNSRAKDSWIGMNSTSRKSYGRWCVAGSSCTPCDEITKIVCLPVCSLCGYDPYFRGGGVIKKVDSVSEEELYCLFCSVSVCVCFFFSEGKEK
jgi:hypothetical protein